MWGLNWQVYVQKTSVHIVQMYVPYLCLSNIVFLILVVIIFWTKLLIYGLQCVTLWPISSGSNSTCSSVWVEGEVLGSKPSNCTCNLPIKKNWCGTLWWNLTINSILLIPSVMQIVIAWIWRVLLRVSTWMSWDLLGTKDIRVKIFSLQRKLLMILNSR